MEILKMIAFTAFMAQSDQLPIPEVVENVVSEDQCAATVLL